MSEARKCDRCKDFYEIPNEQQDKLKPYDLKGAYAKLLICDNNREYPETVRWYDLCPKCVELLNKWLENPDNYDPHDLIKNVDEEYLKASEAIKTYAGYKDPCKSCHNGVCEQCDYGYCSEEDKKKRWLENHKEETKLSDPYEEGGL